MPSLTRTSVCQLKEHMLRSLIIRQISFHYYSDGHSSAYKSCHTSALMSYTLQKKLSNLAWECPSVPSTLPKWPASVGSETGWSRSSSQGNPKGKTKEKLQAVYAQLQLQYKILFSIAGNSVTCLCKKNGKEAPRQSLNILHLNAVKIQMVYF